MSTEILKEKIEQAVSILKEKKIDLWMTFVRESSTIHDPAIDLIVGKNCTWQSAFIINSDGETTAIVGSLEADNFKGGLYKNVIGYLKSIREPLIEYLNVKKPNKIAINFSKDSDLADGLTHGMYLILLEHFKRNKFQRKINIFR